MSPVFTSLLSRNSISTRVLDCTCGRRTSRYCFTVEHNGTSTAAMLCTLQSTARRLISAAELHGARRTTRKIASKACQYYRARKVRCNMAQDGVPCTNWRLDDFKCVVTRGREKVDANREYITQHRQLLVPSSRERGEFPSSRERGEFPTSRERGKFPCSRERGQVPSSRERGSNLQLHRSSLFPSARNCDVQS
jgi:hypothetical protein